MSITFTPVGVVMEDREKVTKQTLDFLKSIKSLDDIKEHKKEIFNAIIGMIKSALEIVKSFFETSKSISTEEKAEEFSKFQNDNFLIPTEIEEEMDRIYNLPGADEIMDDFQQELEKQMEPYMEEISQQMSKLAEEFFGDMLGGLAEGITQGLEDVFGDEDGEHNISSEPGEDEKLDAGQIIYNIQSLEDLKNNENKILKQIEDQLNADLEGMKFNQNICMENDSIVQAGLIKIEKRQKLLERELDKEFDRIEALPDAAEYTRSTKEKIKKKLEPTVKQINGLLKKLKKEI